MDDNACKNFIRDNFSDEVFVVYNSLPLGIMRADMWRLAVMYVHGGIYADTDTECIKCIDELLKDDNKRENIKKNLSKLYVPNSATKIYDLINNLVSGE